MVVILKPVFAASLQKMELYNVAFYFCESHLYQHPLKSFYHFLIIKNKIVRKASWGKMSLVFRVP